MKLLLDQNLSPSLVPTLQDVFPGREHVRALNLDRAPDRVIWDFAREQGFSIVTKDSDFSDKAVLEGFPPKVIWLKTGNCTTEELKMLMRGRAETILQFGKNPDAGVLVVRHE